MPEWCCFTRQYFINQGFTWAEACDAKSIIWNIDGRKNARIDQIRFALLPILFFFRQNRIKIEAVSFQGKRNVFFCRSFGFEENFDFWFVLVVKIFCKFDDENGHQSWQRYFEIIFTVVATLTGIVCQVKLTFGIGFFVLFRHLEVKVWSVFKSQIISVRIWLGSFFFSQFYFMSVFDYRKNRFHFNISK